MQSAIEMEDRDTVPLDLHRDRSSCHELGLGAETVQAWQGES
ncbi:MAG TPA: hypothetical protein VJQ46_16160 [Gemmatimonadales bacterium]|nr:hypothetical protein [Gemmatimonadales bacterium]